MDKKINIYRFENKEESIPSAVSFLSELLARYKITVQNPEDEFLYLTELLKYIAREHKRTQELVLQVSRHLGDLTIQLFFIGEKLDLDSLIGEKLRQNTDSTIGTVESGRLEELFRNHFQPKNFNQKYRDGLNTLTFTIHRMRHKSLVVLLLCLLSGAAAGLALRSFAPAAVTDAVTGNLFQPISEIFIKCIKMLIAPLIFFTISSSVSSYTDLNSLGRMGRKISIRYCLNALIALVISAGLVLLFRPGAGSSASSVQNLLETSSDLVEKAEQTTITVKDTIMNIFPGNFFKAFVDSSIMQIIFISFLLGIATALLTSEHREHICGFLNAGSALFSKMISIIMLILPISVFCSMANAMITLGNSTLIMLCTWLLILILAFAVMTGIYILLIWKSASIRPGAFLKQYGTAILGTFAMGSCNSSMPLCISESEEKLGVDWKVASFSIPIGVSLHCASNCVFYTISLFFLANLYSETEISPLANMVLFLSIFILGIGAPSIPGSGPICVAVLLSQINMPMNLITLIIGLDPIVSMFKSACSCIEDSYVTLALARSEKMLHLPHGKSD